MFKNRVVARKACILAGVDCTHPITMRSLMHGYKPEDVKVEQTHDNSKG